MEAIGRKHEITCAFLQQACLDIERNGLRAVFQFPALDQYRNLFDGNVGSNVPLISRSSISRHSKVTPVLPGRLPLNNPQGKIVPDRLRMGKGNPQMASGEVEKHAHELINADSFQSVLGAVTRNVGSNTAADGNENKRKRTSPGLSAQSATSPCFILPDRTNSSTSSPAHRAGLFFSPDHSGSSHTSPPLLGNTPEEMRIDLRALQEGNPPAWQAAQMQPMQDSIFTSSATEALFSMAGYNDTTTPTSWDNWVETMAWGSDNPMPSPGAGP